MILCLDPGSKEAGVAVFLDKRLQTAFLARGESWKETADDVYLQLLDFFYPHCPTTRVSMVVIERMQVYESTGHKKANDLITLAIMSGRVTGFFNEANVHEYQPREWKGGVPKAIMTKRIISKLPKEEFAFVVQSKAQSKMHNVYDAVGIGIRYTRGINVFGR